jgi:hypothetical protein
VMEVVRFGWGLPGDDDGVVLTGGGKWAGCGCCDCGVDIVGTVMIFGGRGFFGFMMEVVLLLSGIGLGLIFTGVNAADVLVVIVVDGEVGLGRMARLEGVGARTMGVCGDIFSRSSK